MGQENKTLTEEQIRRKVVLKNRFVWMLVIFDVALLIYLIIQIALIF